jgi:hypothetical protein
VKETARKLGELRGLAMEEIGRQTTDNFYSFFKLAEIAESKVSAPSPSSVHHSSGTL